MTHIYDWLNDFEPSNPTEEVLYKFLDFKTRPIDFQFENKFEIEGLQVYCKYKGKKYEIVGASFTYEIFLKDLKTDFLLEDKIYIDECREFSFKITGASRMGDVWLHENLEFLDEFYWNFSKTTSKYRNQFLNTTTKETEAKIKSGEYILTNLN